MRRMLAVLWIFGLLSLHGAALAQEGDQAPDEQGQIEPARPYHVDVSAVEVAGNDRGQVPVGKPTRVTLRATNTSAEAAADVTVKIADTPNTRVSPSTLSFGDLAADGGSADQTVTVTIVRDEGCEDYTGWVGTLASSLGEHEVRFGVSVLCPGPRLVQDMIEFVGGDGDGIAEPGETLEVYVTYRNNGRDAATDVRATLRSPSDGVTVTDATATWGTIAPDAVVRATDPFVISIAEDAKPQDDGCSWGGGDVVVDDGTPPEEPVSSDGSGSGSTAGSSGAAPVTSSQGAPETAPEEPAPRPQEEPAAHDPSVAVVGDMKVTTAEISFDDVFSNQMACLMAEGRPSGGAKGAPTEDGTIDRGEAPKRDVLAGGVRTSEAEGRGTTIAVAALLLLVVASQLGWRVVRARAN